MNFTIEGARKLLEDAGVFFYNNLESETQAINAYTDPFWTEERKKEMLEEIAECQQTLNMNDTWGWACADGEKVPNEKLPEVAELFWRYGWAGILYWVSEQREQMRSEFHDNNRMIDFVRHEEALRKSEPNSSKRAYAKLKYMLGV